MSIATIDELRRHPGRPLLLADARVITGARAGTFVGDVLVAGDRIAAVGPGLRGRAGDDALVVDASRRIVVPGFVDAHVHAWEGSLRGFDPGADFAGYLALTHFGFAPEFSPEDVAIAERLTAAQAINAGTTTIVDNSHIARTRDHTLAAVGALLDTGVRAVHAVGAPKVGPHGWRLPDDLPAVRDEVQSGQDRVRIRMFDARPSVASWTFADEHALDVCAELGSWVDDVEGLARSGLMRPGHAYNHGSGLADDVWSRIAASGAAVNLSPRSDSQYGLGAFAPVLSAIRHGIQVGISSDNETSYGHDLFTEMRVLLTLQRGSAFAERDAGRDAPALWGPADVLRAATVGGALNAGLADQIGTIEAGKKADLVLISTDDVTTRLGGDPVGTVVSSAGIGVVDGVLIDGVVRKWGGRLVGLDYEGLARDGERSRTAMLERIGASVADLEAGRVAGFLAAARGPGPFER